MSSDATLLPWIQRNPQDAISLARAIARKWEFRIGSSNRTALNDADELCSVILERFVRLRVASPRNANVVARNAIIDHIRKYSKQRRNRSFRYTSLCSSKEIPATETAIETNPELFVFWRELLHTQGLKTTQKKLIIGISIGMSQVELAKALGISEAWVSMQLSEIRKFLAVYRRKNNEERHAS